MEELQFVWGWQPALYLFLGGVGGVVGDDGIDGAIPKSLDHSQPVLLLPQGGIHPPVGIPV